MWRFLFYLNAFCWLSSCAHLDSRYAFFKTRYAGDLTFPCGRKLKAEDYCGNFLVADSLRKDPNASRVRKHCLNFYGEAVRATHLICAYFEEMDSLTFWGEGADSATISAKGKRIHRKYSRLAGDRADSLDRAFRISGGRGAEGAVEELLFDGRSGLRENLECREVPGRAPPFLLLGLASQLKRDQKETYDRLKQALANLSLSTSLADPRPFLSLRKDFGVHQERDRTDRPVEKIVFRKMDELELIAAGKAEAPSNAGTEQLYAYEVKRARRNWPRDPVRASLSKARDVPLPAPSGRGLASVQCPERNREFPKNPSP